MKAISLWQPWGSLWLSDAKEDETRHWPTAYRGWLLVHAAKRFEKDFDGEPLEGILVDHFGSKWRETLPTGALIGAVKLIACRRTEDVLKEWGCPPEPVPVTHWVNYQCGDFSPGRFAWRRADDFIPFSEPISYRGMQGLFTVPDSILPAPLVAECGAS